MEQTHQPFVEAWRTELQRGLGHLRAGAFDRALACLERAYRLEPARPEVCYALGRERMRRGDHVAAERLLQAAWAKDDTLLSAAGALARCLGLHLGRLAEAHAVLDAAEAQHGAAGLVQVVRSELLLEQGRVAEARQVAEAVLTDDLRDVERDAAHAVLARVSNREGLDHAERGEHEAALFWFRRAAGLDPEWSSPHTNQGAALVRLGKPDLALAAYERAVMIEPSSGTANYNLGLLWREAGEPERARAALERALGDGAVMADAALVLADLCLDQGEPKEAVDVLARVIEEHPAEVDLWARMGTTMAAVGAREDAEACWRRVLALEPDHVEACLGLADLLARESRFLEATVLAQRAQRQLDAGG